MKMYHFNEISVSLFFLTQLMIEDDLYLLIMFLVQGYKNIKSQFIELIVFYKPEMDQWHKSIILVKD